MPACFFPPPLEKHDTIGVMAPSSRVDNQTLKDGAAALEQKGYKVLFHPQTFSRHGQSAGTGEEKAEALHDLIRNPAVKAVIFARGGNRAAQMLEHIDFRLLVRHPKIMMGYSDITALLNAIYRRTGLVTFHGPLLHRFGTGLEDKYTAQCLGLLSGRRTDLPLTGSRILRKGRARGPLVGGNLSLVCGSLGTPWAPRFKDSILFLEDCEDEVSRYDRMLTQLYNAGIFGQISGLILGRFTGTKDTGSMPFGFTLEQIVQDLTGSYACPVIVNAPFGHGDELYTLPVGAPARLDATKRSASLVLTRA